jgi:2'-5' RNA ligase
MGTKGVVHLMHAVVSLFDEHTTKAVKNLWTELANDFGVHHLAEVLPYPHFSYQIARHYDESQLTSLVEQLAHQATPFSLQAGGVALFTGLHPVLYVPIVRTIELSHFHQKVWQVISRVGEGIPSYYEPNFWMPHITLAEHDIRAESLQQILPRLSTRELFWEIHVDNLAIIWDTGTQQELRSQFYFQTQKKQKR